MMPDPSRSSTLTKITALLVFSMLTLSSAAWFFWSVTGLYNAILQQVPVIYFDKGALYMLGASTMLAILTIDGIYEGILKLTLTEKLRKIFTNGLIISAITMFALPHVIHYPVESYLRDQGYRLCEPASYQWLMYRKIVYVTSVSACKMAVENKK